MFAVYISHQKNSSRHYMNDDDMFTLLYNDILLFTTYGICLIYGDFNARTKNLTDVIEMEYDDIDRTCMLDISYDMYILLLNVSH